MSSSYHTSYCHDRDNCTCIADHERWAKEFEEPTSFEQIAYWATVLIAGISTLVVIFGTAGYFFSN